MTLRTLLARLAAEAEAHGESTATLQGGASLRYRASGGRRQLVITRVGAAVGVIETATFIGHAQIPPDAVAWCALPTPGGRWRVVVEWGEDAAQGRLL